MLQPLSEIELSPDEVLVEGFRAELAGTPVTVTAVLERTCVCLTSQGDRQLANKKDVLVERENLPIRRRFG